MRLLLILARRPLREHQIPFTLGHALYMKSIHGGKAKNDKIDSYKIALRILILQSSEQRVTYYEDACILLVAVVNSLLIYRILNP